MSKRILAIEDHEENRRLLRDLLTSFGYELIEALTSRLSIPVHAWDERLTTAEARRRAPPGGRRGREDALAAAIMLQSYMDHLRPHG